LHYSSLLPIIQEDKLGTIGSAHSDIPSTHADTGPIVNEIILVFCGDFVLFLRHMKIAESAD